MFTKPTILLFLLGFLSFHFSTAQSYSGPESVEFDSLTSCYYVANTTTHQILKRTPSGSLQVFATLAGTGPHGIEILNNKLYACNGGSVRVFNLLTGALLNSINLGATFLNGITHSDSSNVFVTDFNAKKIYRIHASTNAFNVFVNNTVQTPNGIIYDSPNQRLLYGTWGSGARIKAISLIDSTQSNVVNTSLMSIDGICVDNASNIYVSNWGNNSLVMYPAWSYSSPQTLLTGLSNPADICYNFRGDSIAIPNSGNNTVVFYHNIITGSNQPFSKKTTWNPGTPVFLSKAAHFEMFNAVGLSVVYRELLPGLFDWQSENLPCGMYIFRILQKGEDPITGKVYVK
jgi:hypothetical protein